MQDPLGPPIDVRHLLAPERRAFVELLGDLDPAEWRAPTPCEAWNVHQLTLHLAHDDLRRLSGQRDGHPGVQLPHDTLDELAVALDQANQDWVDAVAPTVSPQLTCGLLRWLVAPSEALLAGLDQMHCEPTVAWAGYR